MGLLDFLKIKTSKQKLNELYISKGYSKIPALPCEEECSRILVESESCPASLVAKEYMSYVDMNLQLTFGHIVMLWWLDNPKTKKNVVPSYFLYQYGLDFYKEVSHLQSKNMLVGRDLTPLAKEKLNNFQSIIRKHKARKSYNLDGSINYHFEDAKRVSGATEFQSTGDYIEDQFIGKSFEQAKDLKNAELAYLSSIKLSIEKGELPPPNPFMRLAIIYRKQKRFDDEEKILERGISYLVQSQTLNASSKSNTFQERLDKVKKLKEKTC
ncbi:hypothetical protein [Streptococcus sp.]|uniref:hypothetical protein n=1 Tax=Streptococcus sp. TaxID=1306 RepID=UPI002905232B|nr:hypothetical protein [Streptococcus sp.]MDU3103307.1 hypothetical protein [Streptococcus sp.]